MSRYGRISWSLMNCQMIRVISSPSSSTTVPSTLILLTRRRSLGCGLQGSGCRGSGCRGSEGLDVGLLGADGLGGLAQPGHLGVGERGLDDLADTGRTDLRLDAEVDTRDAVLAVDPGAHRHHGTGVGDDGLG